MGGRTQAATQTHTHAFNANKVLVNVLYGGGSVESVPSEVRYYTTAACLSRETKTNSEYIPLKIIFLLPL